MATTGISCAGILSDQKNNTSKGNISNPLIILKKEMNEKYYLIA